MKNFFFILCFAASVALAAVAVCATNLADTGTYANARYGFALHWKPDGFQVRESDNGDGVTVADPRGGMELRAWGSMAWSVQGMDFAAGVKETGTWFDTITLQRVNQKEGWFVLSGYSGHDILYVKGFYDPDVVCFLSIRYAATQRERFDAFVTEASRSFRRN